MDISSTEKLKKLASTLKGDLNLDLVTRVAYSTDASMYQIVPDAVFSPKDRDDVLKIVGFCRDNGVSIISRGAGTNMTGAVLGRGIVLDFSKYFNRIIAIDTAGGYVIVEPGLVLGELAKELKKHGMFFPPDPSSVDFCTAGGAVANNSSGIHAVKYGDAKDWVMGLEVVLADGTFIDTEELSRRIGLDRLQGSSVSGRKEEIVYSTYRALHEGRDLIARHGPKSVKNSSGYNLKETYLGSSLDFNKLFTGSEGTLGIITRIKFRIAPIPAHNSLLLASFATLEDSLAKINEIIAVKPSACELIDEYLLSLIKKENPGINSFLPDGTGAVLLIEFDSDGMKEIEENTARMKALLNDLALRIDLAESQEKKDFIWGIRKAASPITNRVEGTARPLRFVEDLAVHPSRLLDFIVEIKSLLKRFGLESSIYGHVGAGNIHLNPNIDMADPGHRSVIRDFADEAYSTVLRYGGTIAGEHGDGLLRAPYVHRQFGPLWGLFRKVKAIFDPGNILNPGKKISRELSIGLSDLRYDYDGGAAFAVVEGERLNAELSKCHGCGTCRVYCPVASTTKDEKDTARSKVSLLRMLANGELPRDRQTLIDVEEVIEHCFNCKQCLVKCPTVIDIPLICSEAKRILKSKVGEDKIERYIGDVRMVSGALADFAPVTNWALRQGTVRRLFAEKLSGIDRRRALPSFFRKRLPKYPLEDRGLAKEKILYHPGVFALFNDPGEALGVINLLKKAKACFEIDDRDCCYVSAISKGVWGDYIEKIRSNVTFLKSKIDDGFRIVTSAASCGLAMRSEYPAILDSAEAKAVSESVMDIHEYIFELVDKGRIRMEGKLPAEKIVFHNPCHLIAQKSGRSPEDLLGKVPGLTVLKIEDSCCGIAGSWGMMKKNYELSMQIGEKLFKQIMASGAEIVVTSCGTCKMQIEQGTGLKVMHTAEFLAEVIAT